MRDSRSIEVSGVRLDISVQTLEHHRHTQLKGGATKLLLDELHVAARRWLQTLDEVERFGNDNPPH